VRVFILPAAAAGERSVEIRGRDFHYLVHVLRLAAGDRLQASDGQGRRRECRVGAVGQDWLRLELAEAEADDRPEPAIVLIQALPKGRKMDQIVRQATEAGAAEILPVFSRHSLNRLEDRGDRERRAERWRRIAREATQQSGGSRVPRIAEPAGLEQALASSPAPGELRLVFHETRLAEGGGSLHRALASAPQRVILLVGPEGGLAAEEVALACSHGFLPITVGRRVLRTETAALFAVAAVKIILEEKETWKPV
jgi:16S rRNA (uracil1498-N3)-methyltransferase